jgi:hypothetical protein
MLVNSKPSTQEINDNGKPFKISAKIGPAGDPYNSSADCSRYRRVYLGGSFGPYCSLRSVGQASPR